MRWREERKVSLVPYGPFTRISIIHSASKDAWKRNFVRKISCRRLSSCFRRASLWWLVMMMYFRKAWKQTAISFSVLCPSTRVLSWINWKAFGLWPGSFWVVSCIYRHMPDGYSTRSFFVASHGTSSSCVQQPSFLPVEITQHLMTMFPFKATILLAWIFLVTVSAEIQAAVNRLDCEDSHDGLTVHCQFALDRKAHRKNLDTCIHIGKESFCIEAKIQTLIRKMQGYDDL